MGGTELTQGRIRLFGAEHRLFVLAFAALFLEMASIRWLNASIQILSYFANLVLVSCFLGLGLGCLLADRPVRLLRFFGPSFLVLVIAATQLSRHGISLTIDDDVIFAKGAQYLPEGIALTLPLSAIAAFVGNALFFLLIGQELARLLTKASSPLSGYSFDLAGSLAGTIGYAALSGLGAPPWIWCAAGLGLLLLIVGRDGLIWNAIAIAASLFVLQDSASGTRWSPYYKVETVSYEHKEFHDLGFKIRVNGQRIQDALRFGPELERTLLAPWVPYYKLPYRLFPHRRTLILGSGSGNEAHIAVAMGAEVVDAVEIDPVLADLGKSLHPHRPYREPAVTLWVDDARAFLASDREPYDLVVMSALDSHKHLPGLSLRLESYVYTVEAFREVKRLLGPHGVFCLNLAAQRPWMMNRTYRSLTEAFGREPQTLTTPASPFQSTAYICTNDGRRISRETLADAGLATVDIPESARDERPATDDWPFLYLETNRIPRINLIALGGVLLLSALAAFGSGYRPAAGDLHFFFLGAGFMLLEARGLTAAALLFGTTWQVNAIVVSGILALLLAANQLVRAGFRPHPRLSFVLLVAALVAGFLTPIDSLLAMERPLRILAGAVLLGFPVIWASFLFSGSFETTRRPASAFGANLLGVVFGASLEYSANIVGLRALFLVAIVLYALASFFRAPVAERPSISSPVP